MSDQERKLTALMAMASNFDKEFSEPLLAIWLKLLNDYNAIQVERAAMKIIDEYDFKTIPPFAVFKKALNGGKKKISPERELDMKADAEWDMLLDAVFEYGRYRKPQLHPTTEYVLRGMGGWDAACDWPTDRLQWYRRDFIERWKLADGNVEYMKLGVDGVRELCEGPQSAREILGIEQ